MGEIAVVGAGYVGLTTAACLAHLGHEVVCADIDEERVRQLRIGSIPILEDGLGDLVLDGLDSGRLRFVVGASAAVSDAEFVFLCVPTPSAADGSADLSFVESVIREIRCLLRPDAIVVNKSTVPVGTARRTAEMLGRDDVAVVSNPEFLREGRAVQDFLRPNRIVVGSDWSEAAERVARLYLRVVAPIVVTDAASAETIKYAANAFLATKVSFANAMAAVCEAVGADVEEVLLGVGLDERIGSEFLRPGPGFGGSCFPKDTNALVGIAAGSGYDFHLLKGVIHVNEQQLDRVVDKVEAACGGSVEGRCVAAWGLTFKAHTNDLRSSPALEVLSRLRARGARIRAFDPAITEDLDGIHVVNDPYAVVEDADVLVVLTEWPEFRRIDLAQVAKRMRVATVVDARNHLDRDAVRRADLAYEGIGLRL
jgi:UDPglucose 6-dehydrogenase